MIRKSARRRAFVLEVDRLEDRLAPAAQPVVSVAAPLTPFIGTNIPLSITFSNPSGSGATNPGFAPWDYVVLPRTGYQGVFPGSTPATAYDGISFNPAVTPTFLGAAVTYQAVDVPITGQVTGPAFAASGSSGAPVVLTGLTPGDQVVFFQLPFGSYAVDQPGGVIQFGASVSNLATVNQALTIRGGGGFSLGNDALSNPATDPPLLSPTTIATVTPTLFTVTKRYVGPENETATGPNFPESYAIDISVAPGQTLTNFQISDVLPNAIQWRGTGTTTASANGGAFNGLTGTTATTASPGGTLVANFSQVVGTGGAADASLVFSFYVPELDAASAPVLPLGTGAFQPITNTAHGQGTWAPIDGRDTAGLAAQDSAPLTIMAKSVAVQKSVAVVGGAPVAQGAVLKYTIDFQVSDYFAFDQLNLADLLPDGVRFNADPGFTPTLSVVQHTGNSASAPFNGANVTVGGVNANGTQTVNFNVSAELITRADAAGGRLIGGDIPAGGTGGGIPGNTNPSLFTPGTTGRIVFYATIQQEYDVKVSALGDKFIKQGDALANSIPDRTNALTPTTGGQVLQYSDLTGTGVFQADTSSASVSIPTGTLAKSIYAINGSTAVVSPFQVQAGDLVTFRLTYTMPTGTLENLRLTDFLPLPVFDATNGGSTAAFTFDNLVSATAPASYHAQFGPTDQYAARFGTGLGYAPPTVATPTDGTNRAIFAFPQDLQDPQQRATTVDVLFTVPVLGQPFADGLFLTNQANSQEGNTASNVSSANTIAQIQLTQPNLSVVKSVVASDLGSRTFGSVTFNNAQIGTTNPRWTGTISSNGLTSNPINSNLTGLQAGDRVEFAILVQNTGTGYHGAFDVRLTDTLPTGFVIPSTGLNIQVRNGAGTPIGFTLLGTGLFDPAGGIQLTDPSATQGSIAAYNATSGANIAVITYDLQIQPDSTQADAVRPGQALQNTASLDRYAAQPGGVDYLPTSLTDPATATIAVPANTKSLVTTSEASTSASAVVIGEIARYRLVVQVPQSASPNFQIVDQLPVGMGFLNDGTATIGFVSSSGSALSSSNPLINGLAGLSFSGTSPNVTPTAILPTSTISGGGGAGGAFLDGNDPVFSLGTLVNNDNVDANPEYVVLEFNALVDNVGTNTTGQPLQNRFLVRVNGSQVGALSNIVTVTVAQPALTTNKTVSPSSAQIGDAVTYTITYTNTGNASAFDSRLTDTVNSALTVTSISVSPSVGVVGVVNNSNAATNTVDVSVDNIPVGASVTITVNATVNAAIVGTPIPNTASAIWTSLPGAGTPNGNPGNATGSTTPGASGAGNGERNGVTAPLSVNTYASTFSTDLNVINPAPVKSMVATSESSTAGSSVAIGEMVRYHLAVQIPHATSPAFQIVDLLPAGMRFLNDGTAKVAFVSASGTTLTSSNGALNNLAGLNFVGLSSAVTPTANFPTASISGGTGAGGAFVDGDQPIFSFADVTNSDANNANPAFIVLEFNALVDNVAINTTGRVASNRFANRVNGVQVGANSNAVDVTIAQPAITNTAKTVPSTGRDPGDTVSYRVTFTNTGTAHAFDARVLDLLPANLSFNLGSVAVTLGGGATGVTNNSSGNTLDVTIADIPVGGTVQIDYTAQILTTVPAGSTITNNANLTYTSLPGGFGTTVNATGSSTPGSSGSVTGERNGSGGINSYLGSGSQTLTVNSNSLTGFVYQDLNNNGVKNVGESGIAGVFVTLSGFDFLNNPVSRVATTDGSGQYTFANVLPSDPLGYTITQTQPGAFLDGKETAPTSGNFTGTIGAGSSTGAISANDLYSAIVIGPESNLTGANYNFGELPPATISGAVYSDANNDGVRQVGEAGLTGILVQLQGTDDLGNPVNLFANTNGTGNYTFTGLRPGSYFLVEPTQPAGFLDGLENQGNTVAGVIASSAGGPNRIPAAGTITLAAGATSANNMFAELVPSSLAGFVYIDANNDSTKQAGEAGLGNVTVTLTGTDDLGNTINQPFTTLSDGSYLFSNLRPGTYVITESQPTNYVDGQDSLGTPGGTGILSDVFSNIVLNAGVNGTSNNFGERLTADLAVAKTDNQTAAIPGTGITYVITVTNNGPSTVNRFTMTDVVPVAILTPTFGTPSQGSYNSGTGAWTGLTLASGQSVTISITGTVDPFAAGTLSNTATVSAPQDPAGNPILDPVSTNNSATDVDTLTPQATLTITKDDGSPTYTPGLSTTYVIVVTNTGPSAVAGASVIDNLPGAISSATWNALYSTSSSGTPGGVGNINATVNLAPGGTATFTVTASIASTATGNLVNTATITNPLTSAITSATDTDTPDPISDLAITKDDGLASVVPGNAVSYTIVVTNNGPSFVTGATVTDVIPAALTGATWTALYAGTGSTGPAGGSGDISAVINLAVGGTATFTLSGTVASNAVGILSNTASVAVPPGVTDNQPNNNSATDDDPLTPQGDLSITKTDNRLTYTPGTFIAYTIVVSNTGPSFVTGATVADVVPANITGVSWSVLYAGLGSGGPAGGNGDINATINLAPGGSATFTLNGTVLASASGPLANTATVTAPNGFTDLNPNNNSATDTDSANPIADLEVVKTGPASANANDTLTYTISITNNGPSDAQSVTFSDPLPAGVRFVSQTQTGGPLFTLLAPGGNVSNTISTFASGASATFEITVHVNNPSLPGTIVNNIATVTSTTPDSNPNNNTSSVQTPISGATLSGVVFLDANTDAVVTLGELGLGGVILSLVDSAGQVIATTTTGGDGSYSFGLLGAGNYTIVEVQPAGYGSSTPNTLAVTLPLTGLTNQNFGETTAALSGTVYFDANNNGTRQAVEPGIQGVLVTLTGTDINGLSVNRTTTSAVDGSYAFTGLLAPGAAGYVITETQPAGYTQGINAAGTAGGVTAVQDTISAIQLNAGQNAPGYNFGERGSVLFGTVFLDFNQNTTLEPGEPGKGGVPITLLDAAGNTVAVTLTNPDGTYLFSGLLAGNYRIVESPPGGFTPDTPTSLTVSVPAGSTTSHNFGLITNTGSLAGKVFVDLSNDGTQQTGEPSLPGVTVTLSSGGTAIATTTTAADGSYVFTGLPAGTYTVTETQPAGYDQGLNTVGTSNGTLGPQDVISNIVLGQGVHATGYNFGELGASLSGTVFNDGNANGVLEGGETGRSGVLLTLRDAQGNFIATATSGGNGNYSFGPLAPGVYSITETPPSGVSPTTPTVLTVSVPPGGLTDQDFGLNAGSTLSGSVYFDANNDGDRQPAEPGIAGVTVTLSGTSSTGAPVLQTVLTGADGSFVFANLPPSDPAGYTLTETQPAGYGQGQDDFGTAGGNTAVQDVISAIALPANTSATGYLFGETSRANTGTITGTVFVDANGTGNPAGQPPIGGITISLVDAANNIVATTTTAGDGSYAFPNVLPGSYTITESQPVGHGNSAATPATTIPVTVPPAGGIFAGNNFGEILSSLAGNIFADNNNDGLRNGPDFSLAGVVVTLLDANGLPVRSTTTDASGNYAFTGLLAGNYTVVESQPIRYVTGADPVGSLGENVANHVANQFSVTLPAGTAGTGYNFAEIPTADPQGYVFIDVNNDGVRQNEPPIPGVTITLTGTDVLGNVVSVTTTTDANGFYQFAFRDQAGTLPLLPGVYDIAETQPPGFLNGKLQNGNPPAATAANDRFSTIDLTARPFFGADYNFGELRPSSLAGYVYIDANNNGNRDAKEPGVAGVTVNLTGTDDLGRPVNATVVTDSRGNYSFQRLRPGTYTLTEVQPSILVNGLTRAGVGVAVRGTAGTNVIRGIGVNENQTGTAYRFGELRLVPSQISKRRFLTNSTGSIAAGPAGLGVTFVKPVGNADPAGFVYLDSNNNGIMDPGEPGIANVLMTLTGVTTAGDLILESKFTDAAGYYFFDQLQPGVYAVARTQPAYYRSGKATLGTLGGTLADDQITDIVLGPKDMGTGYNFGLLPRTPLLAGAPPVDLPDGLPLLLPEMSEFGTTARPTFASVLPAPVVPAASGNGTYEVIPATTVRPQTTVTTTAPPLQEKAIEKPTLFGQTLGWLKKALRR